MSEEQALGLLDNTVSQVQLSRGDHARLVEAVRVLKALVDNQTKKNSNKSEEEIEKLKQDSSTNT